MYGLGYLPDHSLRPPIHPPTHPPSLVSPCGGVGVGEGTDKLDSAALELIIMPRLSLTDTRDLSSATQTYISPLAAQCVPVCVPVCICMYVYVSVHEGHAWQHSLILRRRGLDVLFTLASNFRYTCTGANLCTSRVHTNTQYLIYFQDKFPFSLR